MLLRILIVGISASKVYFLLFSALQIKAFFLNYFFIYFLNYFFIYYFFRERIFRESAKLSARDPRVIFQKIFFDSLCE